MQGHLMFSQISLLGYRHHITTLQFMLLEIKLLLNFQWPVLNSVFWNYSASVAQNNFILKYHCTEHYYLLAACCDRPLPVVLKLPAFPTPTMLPAATNCLTCTAGNTPVTPDFTRCPWRLHVAIRMGDAWKQVLVPEGKSWCNKHTDHVQKVHFPQSQKLYNKLLQLYAAHLFHWQYRYFPSRSLSTLTHLSDHFMSLKHSITEEIRLLHSQSFYLPTTVISATTPL